MPYVEGGWGVFVVSCCSCRSSADGMNVFNLPLYRGVSGNPIPVMCKWLFLLPMGLTIAKGRWQATHCCPPPCSLIRTTEMPRVHLILF